MKQKLLVCVFISLFLFINGQAQDSLFRNKIKVEAGIGGGIYSVGKIDHFRELKSTNFGANILYPLNWGNKKLEIGIWCTQNYFWEETHSLGSGEYREFRNLLIGLNLQVLINTAPIIEKDNFKILPALGMIIDRKVANRSKLIFSTDPTEEGRTNFIFYSWSWTSFSIVGGLKMKYLLSPSIYIELHTALKYGYNFPYNNNVIFSPLAVLRLKYILKSDN